MTQAEHEAAARMYEGAAVELERAAGHLRVSAEHFRSREQPCGTAHAGRPGAMF